MILTGGIHLNKGSAEAPEVNLLCCAVLHCAGVAHHEARESWLGDVATEDYVASASSSLQVRAQE